MTHVFSDELKMIELKSAIFTRIDDIEELLKLDCAFSATPLLERLKLDIISFINHN